MAFSFQWLSKYSTKDAPDVSLSTMYQITIKQTKEMDLI
jgi:hypothetical protein